MPARPRPRAWTVPRTPHRPARRPARSPRRLAQRDGHLAGPREDASRLEEPRYLLPAQRRRGGPQLLRRRPEVPRPTEGVAPPEGPVAQPAGLRAVRPYAVACAARQVLGRR